MKTAIRPWLLVLAGALCVLPVLPPRAFADQPGAQDFVPRAQPGPQAGAAEQERIIASVEKRYNAKVVKVAETTYNGRPALRLRLLSTQRVWSVVVDAANGQVLQGS